MIEKTTMHSKLLSAFIEIAHEGNFESEDGIPEEVYDALNSSFPFECMQALYSIE